MKDDGTPARIDKAFSWENPMSAHGLMQMVIANAQSGDPYKIDTLFLYMANMAWNSSMNTAAVMEMLTDKGAAGDDKIPPMFYCDAYSSEMIAYADLIRPDATYLERHDCISLLDRPICVAAAAADREPACVGTSPTKARPFGHHFCRVFGHGSGSLAFLSLGGIQPLGIQAFLIWGLGYGLGVIVPVASLLHLGPPTRALRALAQVRTSWLCREAWAPVAAPLMAAPLALAAIFGGALPGFFGIVAAAMCPLTIFATSVICAQLSTLPH